MRWLNDEIRYFGPFCGLMLNKDYRAMWGIFPCGHARAFPLHKDEPLPEEMPCPVCDEGHVVPARHLWSDVANPPGPDVDPRYNIDIERHDRANPPLKAFKYPRPDERTYNADWVSTPEKAIKSSQVSTPPQATAAPQVTSTVDDDFPWQDDC